MKICVYCKTEYEDENLECKNCGSAEFENKCNNCNEVFDAAYCPGCGTKAGEPPKVCTSCGAKSFEAFCPKCGNAFADNNNRNVHTSYSYVSTNTTMNPEEVSKIFEELRPDKMLKEMGADKLFNEMRNHKVINEQLTKNIITNNTARKVISDIPLAKPKGSGCLNVLKGILLVFAGFLVLLLIGVIIFAITVGSKA